MSDHNVIYFKDIIKCQTTKLHELCLKWRENSTKYITSIPEDVEGQIRSTIGQAELLMGQRFKQFEGLIHSCEFHLGEKKTTYEDLDGFWDMINFQVKDVEQKFQTLSSIQENDWKLLDPVVINELKPRTHTSTLKAVNNSTKTSNVKAFTFAARKRLAEAKAQKMLNESDEKENQKIFEAPGFFVVNSPIKKVNANINLISSPRTPMLASNNRMKAQRTLANNYLPLVSVTQSSRKTPTHT